MGGRQGRLIKAKERKIALQLIDEAHAAGSRLSRACALLEIDIRTYQRWEKADGLEDKRNGPRTAPANKLTEEERENIIAISTSKEYCDLSPCQIVPRLADQGKYVASESSFYRVLRANDMVKHRGTTNPCVHSKPKELIAVAPNNIWSWDITFLKSTVVGIFFYLYVIMDIYSRKIVGHQVYATQSAEQAEQVVVAACLREEIKRDTLALHSDNGSPMKGSTLLVILPRFSGEAEKQLWYNVGELAYRRLHGKKSKEILFTRI